MINSPIIGLKEELPSIEAEEGQLLGVGSEKN
jgi:hypothetical protein